MVYFFTVSVRSKLLRMYVPSHRTRWRFHVALGAIFLMLFGVVDAFSCGLEVSSSGVTLALHADEDGSVHSDVFGGPHEDYDIDRHVGDDKHQDCVHGHCHHLVSMIAASANVEILHLKNLKVEFQPPHYALATLSSLKRPPRV